MINSPCASLVYSNYSIVSSLVGKKKLFLNATFSTMSLLHSLFVHPHWVLGCSRSHNIFSPLSLGWTLSLGPWLFAWQMHDWVSWLNTHSPHTVFAWWVFFCEACFLPRPRWTSSLCPCVNYMYCLCVFCYCPLYCVFMCSGPPNLSPSPPLPSLPFLSFCPAPFLLRHFRWHPQTHSGILTQSGHDPEWQTAPQAGVQWPGLVTGQSCWQ